MNKEFFERIEKNNAHIEGSSYITHTRNWGSSVVLDANTKIHFIDGEGSVHFHKHRTEDYIVYAGEIEVYRGTAYEGDLKKTIAHLKPVRMFPGDRITIPPQTVHVPVNIAPGGSVFIEVDHGPYAEEDVVRVYDKDGRDSELVEKWSALGYERGMSVRDLIVLIREKDAGWIQPEEETKMVVKPWGNGVINGVTGVGELWLNYRKGENVGDKEKRYVFKKLYVKAGTRMSFQYHINKLETNHLISGEAEAWLENDTGEIEKKIVAAGDSWTIPCGRKHRIIARTDMVMLEASTPEVDDVIRLEDDAGRPDGRINAEHRS